MTNPVTRTIAANSTTLRTILRPFPCCPPPLADDLAEMRVRDPRDLTVGAIERRRLAHGIGNFVLALVADPIAHACIFTGKRPVFIEDVDLRVHRVILSLNPVRAKPWSPWR